MQIVRERVGFAAYESIEYTITGPAQSDRRRLHMLEPVHLAGCLAAAAKTGYISPLRPAAQRVVMNCLVQISDKLNLDTSSL